MTDRYIKPGQILIGPLFHEPMRVETVASNGSESWVLGLVGLRSEKFRLIEVKGIGAVTGTVLLTPNERRVAEDRRDCYGLYVVTSCKSQPCLQEPIKNPARFPWHEVKKGDHYYLSVDALTQPMRVREPDEPYGTPPR